MQTAAVRGGASRQLFGAALALTVLAVTSAACGGDDDNGGRASEPEPATAAAADQFNAQVASFDLATDSPRRFIVGLTGAEGRVVSFGTVRLNFAYLGTREAPTDEGTIGPSTVAPWIPIPGQKTPPGALGPRIVDPGEGVGVYEAKDVAFDRAGFWGVVVTASLEGRERTAQARFEVIAKSLVPGPGDPAPRSVNLLPGAPDAPPKAVDSRADAPGAVPDPELHGLTVADAISSGKPTLVVVSTPTFCESRFCGPVTDMVQQIAKEYGDKMQFVHIEVWRDFEKREVNKAAAEWIMPPGAQDANEPWVFLVGRDGVVTQRWDNVASEPDVRAAVQQAVG